MTHLDEKTLELYVLDAKEVADQRAEIERHLKECAGCSALFQEISDYYSDVRALQPEEVEASTKALTVRDWIVHARAFGDRPPARPVGRSLPLRAVIFAVRHPVVTSLSFLALLAAALLLSYPKKGLTDLNPSYARAKDEFLIAYNKGGEELWRKHFGRGYDYEDYLTKLKSTVPLDQLLSVVDVDGDGKNEVVCINPWAESFPLRRTVYCYNADGTERWNYAVHRTVSFGSHAYADDYIANRMMVGDFDRDGVSEVIASVDHQPDFPCVLVKLDARNGRPLGEYWHPGYLTALNHKDIDGDGVEELMFGGVNNAYGLGALVILDPRHFSGHAPGTQDYIPLGVPEASEKYYLLFPRNDMAKVALDNKGIVGEITPRADGTLQIGAGERVSAMGSQGAAAYYFDNQMRVVRLLPGDEFRAFHDRMVAEGKLTRKLDEQYYKELREGVRYWDGERFVKNPTMNKKYTEVATK